MEDLIRRSDALKAIQVEIDKIKTHSLVDGTARLNLRLAKNIIEDIPAVGPMWVPCDEGLPSEYGEYLVTAPDPFEDGNFVTLIYYGKPKNPTRKVSGACWFDADSEYGDVVWSGKDVIAWMPLPEPYKIRSKNND